MSSKTLEEFVEEAKIMSGQLKEGEAEIYTPKYQYFLEKTKTYWENLHPKTALERTYAMASPGLYALWKLPDGLHEDLNQALGYTTLLLSRAGPLAAISSGAVYGVSELVYGIKTKSGKRFLSGLVGLLTHLRKIPEARAFSERAMSSLKGHFDTFQRSAA